MTRILIVDDDPGLRRLVELTLGRGPFEILTAADGHDALRQAREHQPTLVLLDWEMPGLSGIEVCRALREEIDREMTILMLSGRDLPEDRRAGLAAGADGYLVKPFSPIELLDRVSDVLGPEAFA